ncbi:hypothetical protein CR513_52800, partial [Mucuna pruriens]
MLLLKIKLTLIHLIDHAISSVLESESPSDDEIPPLEDCIDIEVAKPIDRVVLVTRCALSIQPKEDGDVEQREHIFHTRCLVQGKV